MPSRNIDVDPEYHNWSADDLLNEVRLLLLRGEQVPMDVAVALMGYGFDIEAVIKGVNANLF